jgi:hypothetical protein
MWENTERCQQIERKIKGETGRKLEPVTISNATAYQLAQKLNEN